MLLERMDFTFGIVTSGKNDEFLKEILHSIHAQEIQNYEILIIGNTCIESEKTRVIPFDESSHVVGWISRKKNILAKEAKYENIVLLHDYICLCNGWYEGFLHYGNDFSICTSRIEDIYRRRARDFNLFIYVMEEAFQKHGLFPYGYKPNLHINRLIYISGAYYVIKKQTAIENPLNERLFWGMGEDVDLSQRLSDKDILLECNPFSCVRHLKYKEPCPWENVMTEDDIHQIESYTQEQLEKIALEQRHYLSTWLDQTFHCSLAPISKDRDAKLLA